MDRGERYEDPLIAVLEAAGAGAITGGGSQLSETGDIEFADVEIELADLGPALDLVIATLEKAGAPEGSEILEGDRVLRTFGTQQCLAIYFDGISLPDEVYASLDFDQVIADVGALTGPESYRGFWQGPVETGIFLFGPDAEDMFSRVEPLLRQLPIAQNARVVIRRGRGALAPREVRLPRHQEGQP